MKYKHEDTIKNVGMFTFILVMIFMKVSNISTQMFVTGTLCIAATLFGVFLVYKNFKIGAEFMFLVALIGLVGFLTQYFNNYYITVLIPTVFIVFTIFAYKIIVANGDKNQIKKLRTTSIITVILCSIIQIIMIVLLFLKS